MSSRACIPDQHGALEERGPAQRPDHWKFLIAAETTAVAEAVVVGVQV